MSEELLEAVKQLTTSLVRLNARCDALEAALLTLVAQVTESQFQKRLERIENKFPKIAADIDYRAEVPDLPDELLG